MYKLVVVAVNDTKPSMPCSRMNGAGTFWMAEHSRATLDELHPIWKDWKKATAQAAFTVFDDQDNEVHVDWPT